MRDSPHDLVLTMKKQSLIAYPEAGNTRSHDISIFEYLYRRVEFQTTAFFSEKVKFYSTLKPFSGLLIAAFSA